MTAVQASLGLRDLLAGKYRAMWAGLADTDMPSDTLHEASICEVLARSQHRTLSDALIAAKARKLKDRVSRALHQDPNRVVLTHATIDLFVAAFGMSTADERRLHKLRSAMKGTMLLGTGSVQLRSPDRAAYETVAVVEEHRLGEDRLPESHLTTHTIRALEDGVASHLYAFDANALMLEVLEGGRPRGGPPVELAAGVYGLEIDLARTLKRGEATTLKYSSTFAYLDPPPAEFRRGAVSVIHSVSIRVTFAATAIPTAIYAAEWDDLDADPVNSRVVAVTDGVVERFDRRLESELVGFWWTWG